MTSLSRFLETLVEDKWYYAIKRLSGNDTGLTGGHQSGIYLPRWFFEGSIPTICRTDVHNPRVTIEEFNFVNEATVAHGVKAIYYNSKYHPQLGLKKKYDEFRITGWGGSGACPLQHPDNTGALIVIAVKQIDGVYKGLSWVSESDQDDDLIESWIGYDVLPGEVYGPFKSERRKASQSSVNLVDQVFSPEWAIDFPSGEAIFNRVAAAIPKNPSLSYDQLLLLRRDLEFTVFAKIEEAHVLPHIKGGFGSVDDFISYSLGVANRRKSRTGKSLELNLAQIFRDAHLKFSEQCLTENRKKPDFIFPSQQAYRDMTFPSSKLHMMASKTCCKDRWRQILSEADRISEKHLFTLQEGVSKNQFEEMRAGGVCLVVPESHKNKYPESIRPGLVNLTGFVSYISKDQK
jgi:hypothetical protein